MDSKPSKKSLHKKEAFFMVIVLHEIISQKYRSKLLTIKSLKYSPKSVNRIKFRPQISNISTRRIITSP